MGHQFSFFWSDEETLDTLSMLAEIEELVILNLISGTSEPTIIHIDDLDSLWSASLGFFLARQENVSDVTLCYGRARFNYVKSC